MAFESKLGLSLAELKPFYTRHLILGEIVTHDVSLLILSLCFFVKRMDAMKYFLGKKATPIVQYSDKQCLSLLYGLEDRAINGIVLFMLGQSCMNLGSSAMSHESHKYHTSGYHILKARQSMLNGEELFYLARLCEVEKIDKIKDYKEAFLCYQQSADLGYAEAYTQIAVAYYRGNGVDASMDITVVYLEKAILQHSARAMTFLASMLLDGRVTPRDPERAKALFEEAALQG